MDPQPKADPLFLEISPIKRDRIKKEQARIKKQQLRDELPVYTAQEIRKLRLEYHEALYLNFEENGCPNSAELLKHLIEFQADLRKKSGSQSVFWTKPVLKQNRNVLDDLAGKLEIAEKAHAEGNYGKEWETFLQLSALYGFRSDDWHWLGKQFMYVCCTLDYAGDFQKHRALSNYLLGKFLIRKENNLEDAKPYLETSRALAQGKHWSARKFTNEAEETTFMESCGLLYEVLYQEAQDLMKHDPQAAINVCCIARRMAAQACHHYDEFTSYLLKGNCEMMLKDYNAATITYRRALYVATTRGFITAVCEARIQLALAYLRMRKSDEAIENLEELKTFAEDNDQPYYVARAHRFLGEYFLNEGNVVVATKLFKVAFHLFNDINDFVNRAEVRNLLAVSAGQRGYEKYTELIRSCDGSEGSKDKLMALIRWKETRVPFCAEAASSEESLDTMSIEAREFPAEDDLQVIRPSTGSDEFRSMFRPSTVPSACIFHPTPSQITTSGILPHTKAIEHLDTLAEQSRSSSFAYGTMASFDERDDEGYVPKSEASLSKSAATSASGDDISSVPKSEAALSKSAAISASCDVINPEQHDSSGQIQ